MINATKMMHRLDNLCNRYSKNYNDFEVYQDMFEILRTMRKPIEDQYKVKYELLHITLSYYDGLVADDGYDQRGIEKVAKELYTKLDDEEKEFIVDELNSALSDPSILYFMQHSMHRNLCRKNGANYVLTRLLLIMTGVLK